MSKYTEKFKLEVVLVKVNIEWSLHCIAHNFNKISNMKSKGIKPLYPSKFLRIIYIFLYKLQNIFVIKNEGS